MTDEKQGLPSVAPAPAAIPVAVEDITERPNFVELKMAKLAEMLVEMRGEIVTVRHEVAGLAPLKRVGRVSIAAVALGLFALPVCTWFFWAALLDPIAPHIDVEQSEIIDRTPPQHDGRRIFEVIRLINSDATRSCTVHAFFERLDDSEPAGSIGLSFIRDRQTFAIASAPTMVEVGRHRRDRLWEAPRALPPGNYTYTSLLRFCNALRCVDKPLPPIPVTFR